MDDDDEFMANVYYKVWKADVGWKVIDAAEEIVRDEYWRIGGNEAPA
jgi:hypothetical protein